MGWEGEKYLGSVGMGESVKLGLDNKLFFFLYFVSISSVISIHVDIPICSLKATEILQVNFIVQPTETEFILKPGSK